MTRTDWTTSPAHLAIEAGDVAALRDLLNAGADIEDGDEHGFTLLRHAVDIEADSATQTGQPLHVDLTALLLARGADARCGGLPGANVLLFAELRGHWLAAELIRAFDPQPPPTEST